ncbi:MAG TPA: hypothetical protein VK815_07335 [Candidatus Acidoferrales bacterium]|jgi:hypothetical protein|nr:hypothetical protein [Candidatus Acidoferrales bacterium]
MKPPSPRKNLLIAESELNRAHLVREWRAMTGDVEALAHQVKTIGSLASMAASIISMLGWVRGAKLVPAEEKTSWLQNALKGAQLVGSLWSEFRRPKE